jgi:transposase
VHCGPARPARGCQEQLRRQSLDARNTIWSILQSEGLQTPKISSPAFEALLGEMLDDTDLGELLRPMATIAAQIDRQVAALDRIIAAHAKATVTCRRLMARPS